MTAPGPSLRRRRDDPLREPIALTLARHTARALLYLAFRLRVRGTEHLPATGPVLIAGNHSGFLDGPIVFVVLPRTSAFLVKSELYDSGFRRVLDFARQIPIRRGTPDRDGLGRALAVLAAGGVISVFPEGTRGTGSLEAIQHGIGYLALHGDCPIVPVVCQGTAAALPNGAAIPRLRVPVDVVFGAPFRLDVTGDPRARSTVAQAAEQIRLRLLDHLRVVTGDPHAT